MATLIANDHDRDLAKIIPGIVICSYCTEDLFYPYIVTSDRNSNKYHVSCAARLAAEITDNLADFLLVKQRENSLGIKPLEIE